MKYDIEALKRKMLVKYPFFGSVVSGVSYKEEKGIPTAATDGETIYYNPEFLEGLSVGQQTFIFAHEVCHIAFNHILRSEGKDPTLWNIATDGVINQFLKKDGLPMVSGMVDIVDAINYDAEELYKKLLQEKKQQGNSNRQSGSSQGQGTSDNQDNNGENTKEQSGSENGSHSQENSNPQDNDGENKEQDDTAGGSSQGQESEDKNQDVGHDTHSMWEDSVKKHKEKQDKKDGKKGLLDRLLGKNKNNNEQQKDKSEVEKKQDELEEMGEKDAFKKNQEDKKKQLEDLKKAVSKQASKAGTTTNEDIRVIDDIGVAKPLIDWRYILREAVKYDADWSYRNATIEDGVVVPHLEEYPIPETEIVLDTSGSINSTLLRNFLRECKNILKNSKLKVGCFDAKFYGFHDVRTDEDIEKMQFQGRGGTDFDVAVSAFSRRVENKIIFTDGKAPMPKTPIDAIWIVFGDEKINPKGGRVINITAEQLNKLSHYQGDTYVSRKR